MGGTQSASGQGFYLCNYCPADKTANASGQQLWKYLPLRGWPVLLVCMSIEVVGRSTQRVGGWVGTYWTHRSSYFPLIRLWQTVCHNIILATLVMMMELFFILFLLIIFFK